MNHDQAIGSRLPADVSNPAHYRGLRNTERLAKQRQTRRSARALVKDVQYRLDVSTLPLLAAPYSNNRTTGSFILIDGATGVTVGAGMINA